MDSTTPKFIRDQIAWLSYLMIGTYCYIAASFGPLMSFLRAELHLNYTLASYHFSAMSFGVIVAGATGERWMRLFGRAKTIWLACAGLCIGIMLLMSAHEVAATISGAFCCGICGSTMCQTLSAVISDRFLELRAVAITESNIAGSLFCSIAPLFVSAFSKSQFGWRASLAVPIAAFITYFVCFRKSTAKIQDTEHSSKSKSGGILPWSYWLCWLLIFLSVASEWSIIFWSADFMEKVAHLDKADAAACVTSFLAAMLIGRITGSRLAREIRSENLLRIASIVAICGFFLFWTNNSAVICSTGLFITGLGISNFYPLTLSLALSRARGVTNLATARMSMASGSSLLLAPLLIGMTAQHYGIFIAYGIVATLLVLCSAMIFLPIWSAPPKG